MCRRNNLQVIKEVDDEKEEKMDKAGNQRREGYG
jgi:hypothetical protein